MTNQTIEQAVEESVEEFMSQYAWGKFFTIELEQEVRENLVQTLTEDRTALILEVRKVLASEGVLSMSVEKALSEINPTH